MLLVVLGATQDLSWAHTTTYLLILAGVKSLRAVLVKLRSAGH